MKSTMKAPDKSKSKAPDQGAACPVLTRIPDDCPDGCDCEVKQSRIPEDNPYDEQEAIWDSINTIVNAYAGMNGVGFYTQWGILIDAYDKDHEYELTGEMLSKNISLKDAVKNLWIGDPLYCLARSIFIKQV